MIRVIYRPDAEADVESVFDWYEARQGGLGQVFRAELESAHLRIARSPTAFRLVFEDTPLSSETISVSVVVHS